MWTASKRGAPVSFGNAVVGVNWEVFSFGGDKQYDNQLECLGGLMSVAILDTRYLEFRYLLYRQSEDVPLDRLETTAVAYGDQIYLWGGRSQDEEIFYDTLLCFDTRTRKWSFPETFGNRPAARIEHSAGVVNHIMYVFGGQSQQSVYFSNSDVYKLNLNTGRWRVVRATGADVPSANARAAVTVSDRIYVVDASTGSDNLTLSYFDTTRETWVTPSTNAGPPTRTGFCAWAYNGFIFMFGGSYLTTFSNELWRYSPAVNIWELIPVAGTVPPQIGAVCCGIVEDKVYVFGGAVIRRPGAAICYKNLHVFEYQVPELQTLCIMKVYEHRLNRDAGWLSVQSLDRFSFYYDNMRTDQFVWSRPA